MKKIAKSRLTIKVGSNLLTNPKHQLDLNILRHLVEQIVKLKSLGIHIVLVTSGAIVCGAEALGIRPHKIEDKQASAAVGQVLLMEHYQRFFSNHGCKIGQILITRDALQDPHRAGLARNTFEHLLNFGVVPIVNENDSVAVDEIKYSDNDSLSADVSLLIKSDFHVFLTDIDGVYDRDPRVYPEAELITNLTSVSDEFIEKISSDSPSQKGRGGMKSKVSSAKRLWDAGIESVIAHGKRENILLDIVEGKAIGTYFRCKGVE